MSWLPRDCHAHTVFSDGTLTVAELVEHVRARGVRFPTDAELVRDAFVQLGIPATAILATDGYVDDRIADALGWADFGNDDEIGGIVKQWTTPYAATDEKHDEAAFAADGSARSAARETAEGGRARAGGAG